MSLGEVITALQLLSENISTGMDAYVADFKSKNGIPRTEDSVQLFQMGLIEITEKYVEAGGGRSHLSLNC